MRRATPADDRTLVPGVDDARIREVLDGIRTLPREGGLRRFARRQHPNLPWPVLLHVWSAAVALGLLLPPHGDGRWRPGRSSAGVAEATIPVLPALLGLLTIVMAVFGSSRAEPSNVPGNWFPWIPAYVIYVAGLTLACVPRTRRFVPWWALAGAVAGAVAVGTALSGALPHPNHVDGLAAGLLAVGAAPAVAILGHVRRIERFHDELGRFRAHEVTGPSRALLEEIEKRSGCAAGRNEIEHSVTVDPATGLSGLRVSCAGAEKTVTAVHDRVMHTHHRRGVRTSRVPSVLTSRPAPDTPACTIENVRSAVLVAAPEELKRVLWLWHDGDEVRRGDPLAVAFVPGDHGSLHLNWTFAPADGVLRVRGEGYRAGASRPKATAVLLPLPRATEQ